MKQIGYKEFGIMGAGDGAKEKLYNKDGRYILRGIGDRGVKTGKYTNVGFTHDGTIQEKELTKEQASIWASSGMSYDDWIKEFV